MALVRLSGPAQADIAGILRTSALHHAAEARLRYRALLAAALRRIAADPTCVPSLARDELGHGLRSLHLRHCRALSEAAPVAEPVHVVFYRAAIPGVVEVVRVLHQRMELGRHLGA